MKVDQHGVATIIENLFTKIKDENRNKSDFFIAIKKRIDGKTCLVLQLKKISAEMHEVIKKLLPDWTFILVKDSRPTLIFTRYGFH